MRMAGGAQLQDGHPDSCLHCVGWLLVPDSSSVWVPRPLPARAGAELGWTGGAAVAILHPWGARHMHVSLPHPYPSLP
jgi:hypothetical protein